MCWRRVVFPVRGGALMVRVGDVEHIGRLFDREPSIDRDAALVVMHQVAQWSDPPNS